MKEFSLALLSIILGATTEAAFVDPQYRLVEWTGWGTSLAWFSDNLGGFDQTVMDEINKAFFSVG